MTQEELEKLGREWQQRLFLGGWRIKFFLVPYGHPKVEIEDAYGICERFDEQREAHIYVVDQATWPPNKEIFSNMSYEEVLVHELLHLLTDPPVNWLDEVQLYLPPQVYDLIYRKTRHEVEVLQNHLCRTLVALKYERRADSD